MPNPSPILALDSSTATGSIAVGDGDRLLAEITLRVAGGSSAAIMPAVDRAMGIAGIRPRELRAVSVSGGPGSFTGVRIAAATAKGVAHALGIPIYAYSGLMVAAGAAWGAGGEVCALFDARRRDVYCGSYRFGRGEGERIQVVSGAEAVTVDEVIDRYRGREAPVFVGEGAVLHQEEIRAQLGARVVPPELCAPRAAVLLWLVRVAPELGLVEDAAAWEPDYVRASGAERIAAARS